MPTFRRRTSRSHTSTHQLGMTLVELMVGITLGLIIVAALLVLFGNASTAGQNLARASSQIENGRYVSELLREDIRLAGFWGEIPVDPTSATYSNPDPCQTVPTGFVNSPLGLPAPVQGYGPFVAGAAPTCLSNRKIGTSALAIRHVAAATTAAASAVASDQQYYVQYSFCQTDPTATRLIFDKTSAAFTLNNFACTGINPVRAYVSRVYYIADCNVCSGADADTTPTLKRLDLVGNSSVITPLAEGIEQLRFELGFNTTSPATGNSDTYVIDSAVPTPPAASVPTSLWQNVMTVKVHFISRSVEKVSAGVSTAAASAFQLGNAGNYADPGDGYARRAYSTTIRLVNPSGARE